MTWFILRFFNSESHKRPGLIIETIELYSLVCTELKSLKSQKGKIQIESAVAVSFDTN